MNFLRVDVVSFPESRNQALEIIGKINFKF